MRPIGVIAGTGVIDHFQLGKEKEVRTKFGRVVVFPHSSGDYVVIPRHGPTHAVPPHRVNYRANIAAFGELGIHEVVATSAVGSMNRKFAVGQIGLVGQFIDFTKARASTFHEDEVVHTDMTNPYSEKLNRELLAAGEKLGLKLRDGLVYVCAEGPRFETAAEIKMFQSLGGDVVGMTGVPEVVLAREMKLEYASVVIATNWAAGMQDKVSHGEVLKTMAKTGKVVKRLIESTVGSRGGRRA